MVVIDVEVPSDVKQQLSTLKKISYDDIVEHYENSFEYEKVNMEAGKFHSFLKGEFKNG